MKLIPVILLPIILLSRSAFPQNGFIYSFNEKFYKGTTEFYFLGFSAYYLQWMASDSSKKYIVDDVFRTAQETGINVIRTWGFNSGQDSASTSVIRYSSYGIKEEGLRALDYVVYRAKENGENLIITLENNFSDFGGIEQYLEWANQLLSPITHKNYVHNDFFADDSIKSWYKYYLFSLLNRINIYTGVKYKNETAIFSFELINEASNQGYSASTIYAWYREMSVYFKSIDNNHMLTTGEIGFDNNATNYSDIAFFYNGSTFLFNGYEGTSFSSNTSIEDIDYSSFHLYPDGWGFEPLAGNTWINDHTKISNSNYKPALLGEFGVINEKEKNYRLYFRTIRNSPSRSAIIWDYVHPDLMNIADKYAFNEASNPELFRLFKEYIQLLNEDISLPDNKDFILYQNYPNPFNPTTTIQYSIRNPAYIKVELFDALGGRIKVIDQGVKTAGIYRLFLSFDSGLLASGIYFYRLIVTPYSGSQGNFIKTKKMMLLK